MRPEGPTKLRNELVITPAISVMAMLATLLFGGSAWVALAVFLTTPIVFLAAFWALRFAWAAARGEPLSAAFRRPSEPAQTE